MAQYEWVKTADGREVYRKVQEVIDRRSDLPCPMINTDIMAPVQSMLDGKMYESKSALRATYRQAGVVEVGNDPARLKPREKPRADRKAIRKTIEKATAEYNQGKRVRAA